MSAKRLECVICDSKKLKSIFIFENFPLYMFVYKATDSFGSITEKMNWGCCDECGCVQLLDLIDPNVLYINPHNPAIGKTWDKHNDAFSDLIKNYECKKILEIGGANLKLANKVINDSLESYTIVDFSSDKYQTEKDKKIKLVQSSFENYEVYKNIDAVIASHTYEHFYKPNEFLSRIHETLDDNSLIFLSVPNIHNQIKDGFFNALNFEHTFYIEENLLEKQFLNNGFSIVQKQEFSKYNLFYVLKKSKKIKQKFIYSAEIKNSFINFIEESKKDVVKINNKLKNKKFYLFGAHIFSQYLIYFGLNKDNIINIIDNDVNKQKNYLCGTNILVESPEIISLEEIPTIVLRTAQYTEEIKKQLLNLNKNSIII